MRVVILGWDVYAKRPSYMYRYAKRFGTRWKMLLRVVRAHTSVVIYKANMSSSRLVRMNRVNGVATRVSAGTLRKSQDGNVSYGNSVDEIDCV